MVRLCCQTQIKWWPSHCLHPIYSPQPEVKLSCLTDVGFWNAIPSYSQVSETCSQILLCPSLQTSSQWSLRLKETHHCHTQTGIPQDIQSLWVQPHWQSPECSGIFWLALLPKGNGSHFSHPLLLYFQFANSWGSKYGLQEFEASQSRQLSDINLRSSCHFPQNSSPIGHRQWSLLSLIKIW